MMTAGRRRPRGAARLAAAAAAALLWSAATTATEPQVGWLAVRGSEVLSAQRAEELFVPGSVLKLVVTAAALHHLGPEHRVTTEVRAAGRFESGVLSGDLVVTAAADPTWSARFHPDDPRLPLRRLAEQLRSRGLRRLDGDLVVDVGRFPGRPAPLSRSLGDRMADFGAPSAALAVDGGTARVSIAPGPRPGSPGSARSLTPGLEVEAAITTVGAERHGRGTVDFLPDWQRPRLWVRGEYPVSEPPYEVEVPMPAPELHAGQELAAQLERAGIVLGGEVRLETSTAVAGEVWARWASPQLADWLPPILADSHNWTAEMLLRVLALEVTGSGRYDDGLEVERRFLVEQVGVAERSFRLDDASGQSNLDLITPSAVVELLRWVRRQPWSRLYVEALAAPGRGTLESARDLPPMAAKTGTLSVARGLAGYLGPTDAEPVIFAVFVQHAPDAARRRLHEVVRRLAAEARPRADQ